MKETGGFMLNGKVSWVCSDRCGPQLSRVNPNTCFPHELTCRECGQKKRVFNVDTPENQANFQKG